MLCPRFDCICELCSNDCGIMFEQDERDRVKAKMLIGIYLFLQQGFKLLFFCVKLFYFTVLPCINFEFYCA